MHWECRVNMKKKKVKSIFFFSRKLGPAIRAPFQIEISYIEPIKHNFNWVQYSFLISPCFCGPSEIVFRFFEELFIFGEPTDCNVFSMNKYDPKNFTGSCYPPAKLLVYLGKNMLSKQMRWAIDFSITSMLLRAAEYKK